jgi:hypothetical protein
MRSFAALAVRLASGAVIALSAASCSLISGASDLEIASTRLDAGGDGSSNDAARDGASFAVVGEPEAGSDAGTSQNDGGGNDGGACRALNQSCTGGPAGGFGLPGAGPCCAPLVCGDARKCLTCLPIFDDCTQDAQCCSGNCDSDGKVCL